MRRRHLFQRHSIRCRYGGIGKIRGTLHRFEHWNAQAHTRGLDAEHLAPEKPPEGHNIIQKPGGLGVGAIALSGQVVQLFYQIGSTEQLFGKVGTVFEDIELHRTSVGLAQDRDFGPTPVLLTTGNGGSPAKMSCP